MIYQILTICLTMTTITIFAPITAKLTHTSGEVMLRRGVDEGWQNASSGVILYEIDSILTGEAGSVTLQLNSGAIFKLGANAILDISELRKLSEQEMFIAIMGKKIDNISPRKSKTKLKIGRIHVVHGEYVSGKTDSIKLNQTPWKRERNGAIALLEHQLVTNAIVKLNSTIQKYQEADDCGELYFRLGAAFENLKKTGQAIEAYQASTSSDAHKDCNPVWVRQARAGLSRLR